MNTQKESERGVKAPERAPLRKLALAALLCALALAASPLHIPIGAAKCYPVQHAVNVLAGVLLGPFYALGCAFSTSLLRNLLGTGSLLAFPGSMLGALAAGLLYRRSRSLLLACGGELFGTGLLGALCAYPVAALLLGSAKATLFGFVLPFALSSLVGAVAAGLCLAALRKSRVLPRFSAAER